MLRYIHIGPFTIPGYGLCFAIAVLLGVGLAMYRAKRFGIVPEDILIVAACAFATGIVGAKIAFLLASYGIGRAIAEISQGNFSALTDSGIVFYGGLIGAAPGAYLGLVLSKERRVNALLTLAIPSIPLAHAIGRVGCFLGGCCYGLPYDGPFAAHMYDLDYTVFPIQLVEAALNLILFGVLASFTRRKVRGHQTLAIYLVCYGLIRFTLEFFRGDLIRGIFSGFSTSQWISLGLIAVAVVMELIAKKKAS